MAVSVKVGKKRKKRPKLSAKDFRTEGESSAYWRAVGISCGIFLAASIILFLLKRRTEALTLVGWLVLSFVIFPALLGSVFHSRLKKAGPKARVSPTNFPAVREALHALRQRLHLPLPHAYIVDELDAPSPVGSKSPYALAIPKKFLETFTGQELMAFMAHDLGHIKAGHTKTTLLYDSLEAANPLLKLVFLPATIAVFMLRAWRDMVEQTADRAAVIAMGSAEPVCAAALKAAVLRDPEAKIKPEEVGSYLTQKGELAARGEQVEAHLRIGDFVQRSGLDARIKSLMEYARSEEFKQALQKISGEG